MKRTWLWIFFVVLLLLPIACLAEWLFTDCWFFKYAPVRHFSVLELDIPAAFFPEPEYSNPFTPMHESSGSLEDGIKTSYWDNGNGLSVYIVERFFDGDEVLGRIAGVQSRLENDYSKFSKSFY